MRFLLACLLFVATSALGQVSSSRPLIGDKWTTAPAACAVGQLGFDTDATAGQNIYGCTAANTWTLQGDGAAAIGSTVTGATAGRVLYVGTGPVLADSANLTFGTAAGQGLFVGAGTATTDVAALSVTRTNNNAAVATGVKFTFTDTTSAAGFLPFQILCGAAGTTNCLSVDKSGNTTSNGYFLTTTQLIGDNGGIRGNSVGWKVKSTLLFGFTGDADSNSALDTAISRVSAGVIGVGTGAAGSVAGTISTTGLIVAQASPAAAAACTAGSITADTGFIYICSASGAWKRVAVTGGY